MACCRLKTTGDDLRRDPYPNPLGHPYLGQWPFEMWYLFLAHPVHARMNKWRNTLLQCCHMCIPSKEPSHSWLYKLWLKYRMHIDLRFKYRVIQNDCWGFNNLSYTIHFRWEYIVAPMDQEILKVFFYVPPLPASIPELKVRIRTAIETITADVLKQFGTNSIFVLMLVESQRVHI